ncbi:MAG: hypothetical protein GY782_03710 [Gammaproteobacteria bacterium]|nr:hypothetical protein [Gammaproteobacteria bacterium]
MQKQKSTAQRINPRLNDSAYHSCYAAKENAAQELVAINRSAPIQPNSPVDCLPGVGPVSAQQLEKLDITTVNQLLFHLPLRYQDRTRIVALNAVRPNSSVAVEGTIATTRLLLNPRQRLLLCRIEDGYGTLELCFYHFSAAQQRALAKGQRIRCFGDIRFSRYGLQMVHPEYRFIDQTSSETIATTLTPIYPTAANLKQYQWQKWLTYLWQIIDQHHPQQWVEELLPLSLRQQHQLPELQQALRYLHQPPADANIALLLAEQHPYQRRLAFEELLAHSLMLYRLRQQLQQQPAKKIIADKRQQQQLITALPFQLTAAQQRALREIEADLIKPQPMLRPLRAMESRRLRPVVRSRRRFLADRFAGTAKAPDFSLIP